MHTWMGRNGMGCAWSCPPPVQSSFDVSHIGLAPSTLFLGCDLLGYASEMEENEGAVYHRASQPDLRFRDQSHQPNNSCTRRGVPFFGLAWFVVGEEAQGNRTVYLYSTVANTGANGVPTAINIGVSRSARNATSARRSQGLHIPSTCSYRMPWG